MAGEAECRTGCPKTAQKRVLARSSAGSDTLQRIGV
jgi:hypothetical protein